MAKSNPSLEEAIAKNPADSKAYLVYADWLQGEGDPRGELIAVQHGLLEDEASEQLRSAEEKLMKDHAQLFFGDPHPEGRRAVGSEPKRERFSGYRRTSTMPDVVWAFGHLRLDWFCGFVRSLWFEPGYYARGKNGDECVAILGAFLAHPSAKFLQRLYVGDIWSDGDGPQLEHACRAIAESPLGPTIRHVEFFGGDHDISGVGMNAAPLLATCKNLERLVLYGGQITIGTIDLPKLVSFAVHSGSLDEGSINDICSARWPLLEDLEIWFGSSDYGASGGLDDVRSILRGEGLSRVTRLGLMNAEFADDLCRALPDSPILKQLKHLDLSLGTLSEDGARALIANRSAFAHLESLDLHRSWIPEEFHDELRTLCRSVDISQQDFDPDHRYVAVGE